MLAVCNRIPAGNSAIRTCVAITIFFLAQGSASLLLAQGPQDYIVTFRDGTIPTVRSASVGNAGAALRYNYNAVNAAAVRVPNANALAALQNDPSVASIIPDRPVSAYQSANAKGGNKGKPDKPGDGGGGEPADEIVPAGVARVLETAAQTVDGSGVGVAIVDTGVDFTHLDLQDAVDPVNSFTFPEYGSTCQDDNGHGTHVAGIVGARKDGAGLVGVAPGSTLYCVKVLNSSGNGSDSSVLAGLDWVLAFVRANQGAISVVNMSLGRPVAPGENHPLLGVIQDLRAESVAVVVAAGNDPGMDVSQQLPAAYPEVISVASTTALDGSNRCRVLPSAILADTASYFTTDGAGVTVSAPGEDKEDVNRGCRISATGILSTALGGGTTRKFGTSMAAPHVAGIVARIFELQSGASVDAVLGTLLTDRIKIDVAPLPSPSSAYTSDGVREGIAQAP